jgi:argininosuccinate synthase
VYEGFFHDPLKADLDAFLAQSQRCVSGTVTLESHGGNVVAVAVSSPHILRAAKATTRRRRTGARSRRRDSSDSTG